MKKWQYAQAMGLCEEAVDDWQEEPTLYWSDIADLTHETQVELFGWCPCEDDQPIYDDCPKTEVTA